MRAFGRHFCLRREASQLLGSREGFERLFVAELARPKSTWSCNGRILYSLQKHKEMLLYFKLNFAHLKIKVMETIRIDDQLSKIEKIFGERISTVKSGSSLKTLEGCVPLLVVDRTKISTRDLFNAIDLGNTKHNSWFLDLDRAYDLVTWPDLSYTLENVNITRTSVPKNFLASDVPVSRKFGLAQNTISCFNVQRPLTFHEVVNLAFQYPSIFNKTIHGIQAYGSRFTKEEDTLNPGTDDTLEIYRKGNPGKGFLKLGQREIPVYRRQ
jgi:hypothetical protein